MKFPVQLIYPELDHGLSKKIVTTELGGPGSAGIVMKKVLEK